MQNGNTTIIHFVRHSIVENPREIFYGRLPGFGLSREGRELILEKAPLWHNLQPEQVFASPLLRARQTAQIICDEIKFTGSIKISKYLAEVNVPYEGLALKDLEERKWDIYTGTKPPYEQPADIFNRMMRFIKKVLKNTPGSKNMVVSHADNILFLKIWLAGYPITYESKKMAEAGEIGIGFPSPASITTLSWTDAEDFSSAKYL